MGGDAIFPLVKEGNIMAESMQNGISAGEIMSDAGLTILIGLVVVFSVLLLLVGVIKAFGAIMSRLNDRHADLTPDEPTEAPAASPAVGNTEPVTAEMHIGAGIPDETVAAIAAAVGAMAPAGTQYAVRSITKEEQNNG